jgi:hypothetical protein
VEAPPFRHPALVGFDELELQLRGRDIDGTDAYATAVATGAKPEKLDTGVKETSDTSLQ